MELKQLDCFLAACEQGSLNRAAEVLFTSQPNVSKLIANLEKEVGGALFIRTNKGLRLTHLGDRVREYAQHIHHQVEIIQGLNSKEHQGLFSISSYPSNMIARVIVDMCKEDRGIVFNHQQGTVEEITDQVSRGESEIGILYISKKQQQAFRHIISHKKLEFVELDTKKACLYVGPNSPLYHQDSVDFQQFQSLRFVRGTQDFFSMEHHLEQVSVGAINTEQLRHCVYTNSDHLTIDLLLHTDVCSLGIDFMCEKYEEYDIKALAIDHAEPFLLIGYVQEKDRPLSMIAQEFLRAFKEIL